MNTCVVSPVQSESIDAIRKATGADPTAIACKTSQLDPLLPVLQINDHIPVLFTDNPFTQIQLKNNSFDLVYIDSEQDLVWRRYRAHRATRRFTTDYAPRMARIIESLNAIDSDMYVFPIPFELSFWESDDLAFKVLTPILDWARKNGYWTLTVGVPSAVFRLPSWGEWGFMFLGRGRIVPPVKYSKTTLLSRRELSGVSIPMALRDVTIDDTTRLECELLYQDNPYVRFMNEVHDKNWWLTFTGSLKQHMLRHGFFDEWATWIGSNRGRSDLYYDYYIEARDTIRNKCPIDRSPKRYEVLPKHLTGSLKTIMNVEEERFLSLPEVQICLGFSARTMSVELWHDAPRQRLSHFEPSYIVPSAVLHPVLRLAQIYLKKPVSNRTDGERNLAFVWNGSF